MGDSLIGAMDSLIGAGGLSAPIFVSDALSTVIVLVSIAVLIIWARSVTR